MKAENPIKKTAVILQPGYLPWLGFFDLMCKADKFVVFDDVQYTVRDWRNRNRIKTPNGMMWLTVPVKAKGVREKLIKDVEIDNTQQWQKKHLRSIGSFYKKAKHFGEIMELLENIYKKGYKFLIDVDMDFITAVRRYLSLEAEIVFSSEVSSINKKDEKLLSVCKSLDVTHYLTGNVAKDYLREPLFTAEGIAVQWHDYRHPYHNQLWFKEQGFISHLSVIDLLFNHGPDSLDILTWKKVIPQPKGIRVRHADAL